MNFERIVRPFQTRSIAPPIQPRSAASSMLARQSARATALPALAADPFANIELHFGAVGETKTFNGNESGSQTNYCPSSARETSRVTHTKRVTNPTDPSQFVDVEVIDRLETSETNGRTKTHTFNNGD